MRRRSIPSYPVRARLWRYGFFRQGARYCDNTECQGTNCTEARRQEAEDRARREKETSR